MRPVDYIALTLGLLSAFPYLCRLDGLKLGEHKTGVVLFHMGLFLGCLWSAHDAFIGQTGLNNILALLVGYLWIAISHSTWPNGPPAHTLRDPAERGRAMIQGGGPKPTEPV